MNLTMGSVSRDRALGILLFIHMVAGLTLPYILLEPITAPPASFLTTATGMSVQVRWSVALLFVGGAVPIAMAVMAWPSLRDRRHVLGLWLLALAAVNFALQAVENQQWLSMLSMSQEHARAEASHAAILGTMAPTVRSAWKWAHYTHLLVVVSWMLLLFIGLYRLGAVPGEMAAVGVVTILLQLGGITLPVLLGYRVPLRAEFYGLPLGAAYLGLALWLMTRSGHVEHGHRVSRSSTLRWG